PSLARHRAMLLSGRTGAGDGAPPRLGTPVPSRAFTLPNRQAVVSLVMMQLTLHRRHRGPATPGVVHAVRQLALDPLGVVGVAPALPTSRPHDARVGESQALVGDPAGAGFAGRRQAHASPVLPSSRLLASNHFIKPC